MANITFFNIEIDNSGVFFDFLPTRYKDGFIRACLPEDADLPILIEEDWEYLRTVMQDGVTYTIRDVNYVGWEAIDAFLARFLKEGGKLATLVREGR